MDYPVVILSIILVIVLYLLYSYFNSKKTSLGKARLLGKSATPLEQSFMSFMTVDKPSSPNYYISYWIYVEEFRATKNSEDDANLFNFKTTAGGENIVGVKLNRYGYLSYTANGQERILTKSFPLQKWCFLILSVESNRVVDCYLDGKLVKSQKEPASLKPTTKLSVIEEIERLENNIFIGAMERQPTTMDPATAWNLYSAGNGGNFMSKMFSEYGVAVQFTKDKKIKAEIAFPP
jgi:hypothetical protein